MNRPGGRSDAFVHVRRVWAKRSARVRMVRPHPGRISCAPASEREVFLDPRGGPRTLKKRKVYCALPSRASIALLPPARAKPKGVFWFSCKANWQLRIYEWSAVGRGKQWSGKTFESL